MRLQLLYQKLASEHPQQQEKEGEENLQIETHTDCIASNEKVIVVIGIVE
jgi:hypothetical protein